MRATLGTRINAGQTCLICGRCGFWAAYSTEIPFTIDINEWPCPDCGKPIDAVVPPPQVVKP